jgi:hypothetical protein
MSSGLQKGFAEALGSSALIEKQLAQDAAGDYPLAGPMTELPKPPLEPQPDPLAPGTLPNKTQIFATPPITPSTFSRGGSRKLIISQPVKVYVGGAYNQPERVRILSENNEMAAAHFLKWYRQNMVTENPQTGKLQYWIREMIPLNQINKKQQRGGNECGVPSQPQYVFAPDAVWYEGTWKPVMNGGKLNLKDEFGKKHIPKNKYSIYQIGKSKN